MTNLRFYLTEEDYAIFSGKDWPSYPDLIAGAKATKPEVQEYIDGVVAMRMKDGVKFPIKTATACQSKWTWSTIWLNKLESSSCHRVNSSKFGLEDFDNFHNLPKKLLDRKLMLQGRWPTGGCEACKVIEDAGGHSDRQHNLEIRGLTPPELLIDPEAVVVSPKIVEIFAQNVCNLSCIYCNGTLSSKIERESHVYGEFESKGVTIPVVNIPSATKEYFDKFISWLEKNVQTLTRLHLLGGETLIQHDLMTSVLSVLEKHPNPNLELCVFSNCNVPDKYWNLYLNRIKDLQQQGNIKVFDLTASIDCWGPQQVYVRTGLNLEKFKEKFEWAAAQGDWLRLNINQTITSMTIRTMPELLEFVNQHNKSKHIGHYFEFITGAPYQHPDAFSYELWADDFRRIFEVMPIDTDEQREAVLRMTGVQKLLQQATHHDYTRIEQLHVYLDELDRRRGTNWREHFSYLDVSKV